MKKVLLSAAAIALCLSLSFAGNENVTNSTNTATESNEVKCNENGDVTVMAIRPFATRNTIPTDPLDVGSVPAPPNGKVYFYSGACRTWWLSQPLPSGATNGTYYTAGGSEEWNSFMINCPF